MVLPVEGEVMVRKGFSDTICRAPDDKAGEKEHAFAVTERERMSHP